MQINGLSHLLKGFHLPSLPQPKATPGPERGKVASNPVRVPVNKQTALLLRPNREWISQPLPPQKLPTPQDKEIERLKAELKVERNAHALTRDDLGNARAEWKQAKSTIAKLQAEIERLKAACREKDSIIAQLEDLKL